MARGLRDREIVILQMLASGGSVPQIAHRLGKSPKTIYFNLIEARRALGARTIVQAVFLATARGLL